METYNSLREARRFSDITIILREPSTKQEKSYPAHRIVLAASFSFFERLLLSTYADATSPTVLIEMARLAFEIMLDYAYHVVNFDLRVFSEKNSEWQLAAIIGADYLGLKELGKNGLNRLLGVCNISRDNIGDICSIAELINGTDIPQDIINKIAAAVNVRMDLSEFSDDMIVNILRSPSFQYNNIVDVYNMVHDLVLVGHDQRLYMLFDYNVLPQYIRDTRSQEELNNKRVPRTLNPFIEKYRPVDYKKDLLPFDLSASTDVFDKSDINRLVVINVNPSPMSIAIIGGNKRVYKCTLRSMTTDRDALIDILPGIGDIIKINPQILKYAYGENGSYYQDKQCPSYILYIITHEFNINNYLRLV